jgi:putative oxidoreductase
MWSLFERHRELAPFFLRVVVGVHLVYGTVDNVISWARMHEFAEFRSAKGFPLPRAGAVVSAWSQFLCGIAFVLGIWVRPAAAIMIVNFLAALAIAHRGDAYPAIVPALVHAARLDQLAVHRCGRLVARGLGRAAASASVQPVTIPWDAPASGNWPIQRFGW